MKRGLRERLERLVGAEALEEGEPREGVPARLAAAPATEEELVELVRLAARERWRLLPLGRGSKLSWTAPPEEVDLVVSTRRLAGVVAYEPGDGTVAARAGTSVAELRVAVARGGHWLTPDVPRPQRATIGGVVAAGASGFDRLRFGPVRHHVLGARVLLADGRVARSGGRLVKNVTGYDVHRLLVGSHGTLGIVLEVALRLFPLPEERALVACARATREEALAAARAVREPCARPLAVLLRRDADAWTLEAHLAGRAEVVADEERRVVAALAREAIVRRGAEAADAAERARDALVDGEGRWPQLRLTATPARLGAALARAEAAAAELELATRVLAHPGVAEAWIRAAALDAPRARRLHERLRGAPARVQWTDAPPELRRALDAPPSPGLPLMHRLARALAPEGTFATGRLHGGL